MTINNNSVEQINVALLDMDKKLKSAISKSASASDFNNLEASVDNIKRTLNETKTGLEPGKTYNINISGNAATADKAKEAEKANKLVNALTVNGITYDGSEAVDAGVQKIENGGTGATTTKGAFVNLANGLSEGANPEDTEHIIFKNTSGKDWGLYTLSQFWEYIKSKISSVLGLTKDNYGGNAATADKATTATTAETADKVSNALTVNGKTYNGFEAVDAGVQTVANGGTGVTTQADINKAFIGNLDIGNSDVTDGTEFVSSWASDNGFAETTEGALNQPYKRQFIKVWNYIKGKISSVLGLTKDNYGGKAASAGNADTVDNYHASDLWRKDGGTWNPNANISLNAAANGDEWSFDISRNGHTGCYWHVWDSSYGPLLKVNADDGKVSAPKGFVGNLSGKASTAGTADNANKLNSFASWSNPFDYDATNGVRVYVYKITMASYFNSILVQIYDDINYARSRKYFLGLWHANNYGYNVSVTDLGGTKDSGLKVWFGNDGNVYLQADVYWTSRISFSYLDDVSDVTITKIGSARYGSNTDINGNVLFTPLADPIVDCGALRANDGLSSVSKEPQILKTDILFVSNKLEASSKMIIPIGAPSSLEDGCIWIER